MSLGVLVVGQTGTGKTTLIKNIFITPKSFVNDVNNEYGGKYYTPETFLQQCQKLTNHILVFEESTIYFSNRGYSSQVVDILVRKRHTKNLCVFVFHNFRTIPYYIFNLCNCMYVFKTNDEPDFVYKRFGKIVYANFVKVLNNKDLHTYEKFYLLQ